MLSSATYREERIDGKRTFELYEQLLVVTGYRSWGMQFQLRVPLEDMKTFVLILAVLLTGCSPKIETPVETSKPSHPVNAQLIKVSTKARDAVGGSGPKLSDDDQFILKLREVLRDESLSTQDKVEAFYLMLRAVGWAFNGSMHIQSGTSYHDYCNFQLKTYYKWHVGLSGEGFSADEFIRLAEARMADAEPLAANGLLLAGIVNPKKMESAITQVLFNVSDATPFMLRSAVSVAVLAGGEETSAEVAKLLERVDGEELLEDTICALSTMDTRHSYAGISGFVMRTGIKPFGQEVETALHAMRAHMTERTFAQFYDGLVSRASDPIAKQQLVAFRERDFAYSLTMPATSPVKIWDGFEVMPCNNGYAIRSKASLDYVLQEGW